MQRLLPRIEREKDLLLTVEVRADDHLGVCSSLLAGDGWSGARDLGEYVERVALLRVNHSLHRGALAA